MKELSTTGNQILFFVIDHMICTRVDSDLRLLGTRNRGDDRRRAIEFGHLDCVKTDGTCAAQDQDALASNTSIGKDATMRCHGWYAHTSTCFEVSSIRKRYSF